ncbi:hypothetical protein B0H17DRAFT_558780 [Mycena rosella]|uniref:Uncharacterized protein n=1 Tax=Mycena rosella TaxID=1033263 RepID=A0AAD7DHT7_MYCRO|nr:hypothetical protein B0H17DRAFT_558780 [Mycena rosella]
MSDTKSPQRPPTARPSLRQTASIDTLPQYSTADDDRRRSLEDAAAPLPEGWFCHLDPQYAPHTPSSLSCVLTPGSSNHHFYVDMNSMPPRSVWHHPRNKAFSPPPPPLAGGPLTSPLKRGFMGKLKEKMILSKADREAEEQQKQAKKQELLARYAKRRAEVLAELEKDGGKTQFGASEYVGPPASPYGGVYRGLMPAPGLNNNLAGWLA